MGGVFVTLEESWCWNVATSDSDIGPALYTVSGNASPTQTHQMSYGGDLVAC